MAEPSLPDVRLGTPQHFRWLRLIAFLVLVLNVADAIFTLYWVQWGMAEEANPLMAAVVHSPRRFVLIKGLLVTMGMFVLWRLRRRPLAVIAIFAAFAVYYGVLLYHLQQLDLHLWHRIFG